MTGGKHPLSRDVSEEVSALIETLHQSGRRLEELTGGEIDAVANRNGQPFVLRHAQEHLRQSEATKQAAILNALPANIALLDAQGVVVSVNAAWRQFAVTNALHGPECGIGVSYLDICDRVQDAAASDARRAAAGIRSVLGGELRSFTLEYACHSPTEQRWFLMTATPLTDRSPSGVVVMHLNITERKQAEQALQESKNLLQLVVENVPSRIFWKDRDLRFLGCNTQFANDAGHSSPEELTGKNDFEMPWKRQAELYRADDRAVLAAGIPKIDIEEPQTTPDGRTIWLRTSKVPLRNTHHQTIGILGLYQDITENKDAELDLRESQRRFSDLLENVELVSLMIDREAQVTFCNEYFLRLTGWQREEVIGHNFFERFIPPENGGLKDTYAAVLANLPATWHHENEILTRSGERRLIRWNNSVLRSGSGEVVGAASIGEDFTEQKQAEIRIRRLNRVHAVSSGINSLIVRVHDRDDLFKEACRIAVEAGAFKLAWIGVLDPQAQDGKIVAWFGGDQAFIDQIKLTVHDELSGFERPACRALRTGQPVICNEIATEPSLATVRDQLLARGYQSLGAFPLTLAGQPAAVLALFAGERGFFDDQEMPLLLELAGNLSFALEAIENEKTLARLDAERKRDEKALQDFAAAMDVLPDAIFLTDRATMSYIHVNATAARMQNMTRAELLAVGPMKLLTKTREELEQTFDEIIAGGRDTKPVEMLFPRDDGSTIWVELRRQAHLSGDRWTMVTLVRDITERKKTEARIAYLNRVHAVLSGINTLIARVRDREELYREACRIAVEHGGFRMAWIGIVDTRAMLIVPMASTGVPDAMMAALRERFAASDATWSGMPITALAIREKKVIVTKDFANHPAVVFGLQLVASGVGSMALLPLLVAGEAVGVMALYASDSEFFQDEELKLLAELSGDIAHAIDHLDKQARLDYLAFYDEMTGLANRRLFLERVAQYMRSASSGGHQLAMILLDLERFKNVNDSLGRPTGDALLWQVAAWLIPIAGDPSLVARVGADVFAVVVPEAKNSAGVARLIEKAMDAFVEHLFLLDDIEVRMAFKVGAALFPDDGDNADTLFRNAEAALNHAKSSGARYLFYTPDMTTSVAGKLTLENELRRALDNSEFVLHYQPKVSCATGKITGFEALLRWQHPQRGLVAPMDFVPMLEETGLIVPVGEWVLGHACAQARRWHDEGLGTPGIAVNVSGRQIDLSNLYATVEAALESSRLTPACLELEFTEGQLMKDAEGSIDLLRRLKSRGVRLSVDDFGTGYSSLAYLKRFPLDSLKVDRAFVRDITADPNDVSITRAIITLAHNLKLKVVAEGVETEGQLGLLIANHCDEIQGYYFSRPVPAPDATELLRSGRTLDSRMMSGMKRSRTLLLVDDEPNILAALKRLLRQDGYEILIALGGEAGLEMLASRPVDVIISDQRMPGMSGVDFLRRVKVLHPETVRLVLSGYTDLKSVTDAINEGAIYKFMTKPWDDAELRSTIADAFRTRELADDNRRLSTPEMTP